jgi:hypothetical protein
MLLKQTYLPFVASFGLFAVATLAYQLTHQAYQAQFAYEYGNIAASIAAGHGFSDLFGTGDHQPTAWMPPFYPYLMALVFFVAGTKSVASLWVLLLLRCMALAFVASRIYHLGSSYRQSLTLLGCFYAFPCFFPYTFFGELHDEWLVMSLLVLLVDGFYRHVSGRGSGWYLLGLFALCAGTGPILLSALLGMAGLLAMLQVPFLAKRAHLRAHLPQLALPLAVALAVPIAWGWYSQQQLGKFVPLKSNMWLEFYMSNVMSGDGLLRAEHLDQVHPWANLEARKKYLAQGEVAFVDSFRQISNAQLDLASYLGKVLRRAANVYMYTQGGSLAKQADVPTLFWPSAKDAWRSLLGAVVPLASIIFLWRRGGLGCPLLTLATSAYVLFSLPYILISHYERYQMPLVGLQAILVGLALSELWALLLTRRLATGESVARI